MCFASFVDSANTKRVHYRSNKQKRSHQSALCERNSINGLLMGANVTKTSLPFIQIYSNEDECGHFKSINWPKISRNESTCTSFDSPLNVLSNVF